MKTQAHRGRGGVIVVVIIIIVVSETENGAATRPAGESGQWGERAGPFLCRESNGAAGMSAAVTTKTVGRLLDGCLENGDGLGT